MKNIILLIIVVVVLGGCKLDGLMGNPEPKLPEATHKGANTFGCYINGKPFVANGELSFRVGLFPPFGVSSGQPTDSTWRITAIDYEHTYEISFDFNIKVPGTYSFDGTNIAYLDTNRGAHNIYPTSVFSTDNVRNGKVAVTHYNYGWYIAGSFEFDAVNSTGNIVHVTDGRFDVVVK